MTYRELTMIDVKEVLRRWAAGHSQRQIARAPARDPPYWQRKIVRRHGQSEKSSQLGLFEEH